MAEKLFSGILLLIFSNFAKAFTFFFVETYKWAFWKADDISQISGERIFDLGLSC